MTSDEGSPFIACVLVTYNRRDLLAQALSALAAQTRLVDRIIVVDNAGQDGTPGMVRDRFPEVHLLELATNAGSAGGFNAGMAEALRGGADWIWLLDDDTIAAPDALERLVATPWRSAPVPEPDLLASRVNWTDGQPHPMNQPIVRRRDPKALIDAAAVGLVPMRTATFVSLLVARAAVERRGLPQPHFFFQADDIDFTARVLRNGIGYLVPDSVVEHRTASAHDALGDERRFSFHVRNTVYMIRGDAWAPNEKPALLWVVVDSAVRFMWRDRLRWRSVARVARALRAGVGPVPPA